MGKVTGFLEFERLEEGYEPVPQRVKTWKEFVIGLSEDQSKVQAARCMDCGTPFCNSGCPVNNIIPDFNDLVYRGDWRDAIDVLHSTNNFPEFTGRVCPAPCEAACTLNVNDDPVGIKSIEHAIIDRAWAEGWVTPQPPAANRQDGGGGRLRPGRAGGGAAARARRPRGDGVREERRIGGLLRYGIPDFKMEKAVIDRRVEQMQAEGVVFRTGVMVGRCRPRARAAASPTTPARPSAPSSCAPSSTPCCWPAAPRSAATCRCPGASSTACTSRWSSCRSRTRSSPATSPSGKGGQIHAKGKHVIVIGGGDTGSDCVGTSNRHGAASVTQFELMPMPPEQEDKPLVWPYWPTKLRTSSSHEEGCEREFAIATKAFLPGSGKDKGRVKGLKTVHVRWEGGRMVEVPGTEKDWKADLVLLAMGFTNPAPTVLEAFGVERDGRGNAKAGVDDASGYATNVPKVFAAGDMRRGQSLVVWAIREGRQAAREVDRFLMGATALPR
jgi:glutamate synthase (NADPH) small chain